MAFGISYKGRTHTIIQGILREFTAKTKTVQERLEDTQMVENKWIIKHAHSHLGGVMIPGCHWPFTQSKIYQPNFLSQKLNEK